MITMDNGEVAIESLHFCEPPEKDQERPPVAP
jgi:hypothetical protein